MAEIGISPIFIHSSFRTGSTWLWSKFRHHPRFYAYYEFYNEALADINLATIAHSDRDWRSRHPVGAPYFLEFAPLLREEGGVRDFDSAMAFADFFPATTVREGDRFHSQRDYVGLLIDTARQLGRIPVLTCTRSLARIGQLRQAFGGLHLSLQRNLLHQWFSYSNQALNGNPYFIGTVIDTVFADTDDRLIAVLRRFMRDNRMQPFADATPQPQPQPNDNLFICFVVLHIYLDFLGARDADAVIDLGDLATVGLGTARDSLAAIVREHSGVDLDFTDAREVISAPMMLFADPSRIDLTVKSIFLLLRQTVTTDTDRFSDLTELAAQRMAKLWKDYDLYCHFSSSSHAEISRLQTALAADSHESDLKMAQEREAMTASLRDASEYAESLLVSRNDIAAEGDGLRTELAAVTGRLEALDAARNRLEAERDAALLRVSEVEAAMERDCNALKAALEDASARAAAIGTICEKVTADRNAARTELAAVVGRSDALDAVRNQLEAERDAALLRVTEVEAAMERDCNALKAALEDASARAAAIGTICEKVTADRNAARTELAAVVGRSDALDAARNQLEAERDAALLRVSEVEAAMERDCNALKAALDKSYADVKVSRSAKDAAQRKVVALSSDAAAWHQERDSLTNALADALRETERSRRDLAAQATLNEQQTAAMAIAQQRISVLDQLLDAQIFDDPAEANIFDRRWAKMIAMLK